MSETSSLIEEIPTPAGGEATARVLNFTRRTTSIAALTLAASLGQTITHADIDTSLPELAQVDSDLSLASSTIEYSKPMRIATYNILWENRTDLAKALPRNYNVEQRASRVVRVIKSSKIDVFGLQEVGPRQFSHISSNLPEFKHYPTRWHNTENTKASRFSQRPIFWDNNRFEKVEQGQFAFSSYWDRDSQTKGRSPWVRLQDKETGNTFVVLNIHAVANIFHHAGPANDPTPKNPRPNYLVPLSGENPTDPGGARKREDTARRISMFVENQFSKFEASVSEKDDKAGIFVVGDINSKATLLPKDKALHGNRQRIPYCILTNTPNALLENAYDARRNPAFENQNCPTRSESALRLDQIYVRGDVTKVERFGAIWEWTTGTSDHRPVYAQVRMELPPTEPVEPVPTTP